MIISLFVAASKNRVIGRDNDLPWRIADDLEYFQQSTKHHPVIMGSRTYESIPPKRRPLPDRTNIILTRDTNKKYDRCIMAHSLAEAIKVAAEQPGGDEIFIVGGGHVFAEALPLAHRVYYTEVDTIAKGDTYFPELDDVRWSVKEIGAFEKNERNEFAGRFLVYDRTGNYPIVEPRNGRNQEYKDELNGILQSEQCPFCQGGSTWQTQEMLKVTQHWFVSFNKHPMKDSLYHFLVTPLRHISSMEDITTEEWQDFCEVRHWLKEEYDMTGDATYVRSGEPLVTGATVGHLHFQIIVPAGFVQVTFGVFPQESDKK